MHAKAGSQRAAATDLRRTQRHVPGSRFGPESDALGWELPFAVDSLECRVSSAESVVSKYSYGSGSTGRRERKESFERCGTGWHAPVTTHGGAAVI